MISFIKLIHLLFALALCGATLYCLLSSGSKQFIIIRINRLILYITCLAMLTGALLIYPKHYSLHTHWIQAAFILMILFGFIISMLNRRIKYKKNNLIARGERLLWQSSYLILLMILVIVIHDAVMKSTLFFGR